MKLFQGVKEKVTSSKKKNKHGFSNFTLLNYLDSSNKKLRREGKQGSLWGKSPGKSKGRKKDGKSRGQLRINDKKVNKSIFSVVSVEPNLRSKK